LTYLLDTNTCIRYLNGRSPSVRKRLEALTPAEVCLCAVVKAELAFGAAGSHDPTSTLAKLATFLAPFTSLPFDDSCADTYGRVRAQLERAGTPIGPNDLMIAAIAITHGLTHVTHNTREFERIPGLSLTDWEA